MSWQEIKAALRPLQAARDSGGDMADAWRAFKATVTQAPVPLHLSAQMHYLEQIRGPRPGEDVRILDHGCGGAMTLLYFAARGYTGGFGVDIGGHCEKWNRLFTNILGAAEQRFFVYDGENLPFADASFDFVFSQEVIEHVRPRALDTYYAEEGRVMKPGAVAYHRVPHRLTPFDSHTRTWLLHYLPRPLWLRTLKLIGRDTTTAEEAIFLRWPWQHRRRARRFIGPTDDRTMDRFRAVTDLTDYEGPKGVRRLVGRAATMPLVGPVSSMALTNFVMLDTVSTKPAGDAR